jgi:Uma2 family endonuclease
MARELLNRGATMITMATDIPRGEHIDSADQRLFMHVSWSDYEALDAMRGERSNPRITFLDGAVDLMSPSNDHERISAWIGHLIGAYCRARHIGFQPYGSWTLKDQASKAAAEADQCFVLGPNQKPRPDLAVEVVWTSGGLDKLEVYRRLGVGEVWFWIHGAITVHVLDAGRYQERERSTCFPELDLTFLCELLALDATEWSEAMDRMDAFARACVR